MKPNAHTADVPETLRQTVEFLGLDFDDLGPSAALNEVKQLAGQNKFSYVVTPNVDHVVALNRTSDSTLQAAYDAADLILCDSRILSQLSRRSGLDITAVPGSDLTRQLLDATDMNWRCAIIGGDAALRSDIRRLYPQHAWTFHQPPMGVRRDPAARGKIAAFVETADADIFFFAIGAPQSEICCFEIARRGRAHGVALCIGASLEFLTGAKKRAPLWMQRSSLEWLHRLASEPKRLGRRYLVEGPTIFLIWLRWRTLRAARHRAASGSNPFDGR